MSAIFRKEMKVYFSSPFGYVIIAILLLFMGLFASVFNFLSAYTDLSYALSSMKWVLIVIIPFMTMRAIAEERHNRTDQLLYSLPIPLYRVVIGKYLALITLFMIPTLLTALYPLLFTAFGAPASAMAISYTSLLGYILMACALIAVCLFVSSLVENQIVAAVTSVLTALVVAFVDILGALIPSSALVSFVLCIVASLGAAALMWVSTKNLTLGMIVAVLLVLPISVLYIVNSALFTSLVPEFFTSLNLFNRFSGFIYGRIDLPCIVFYLTFLGFFLFLTVQSMEKRRRA